MRSEVVTVTPDMARRLLLSSNKQNRNLRPGVVDKYARDMAAGNWRTTHQGLAFYVDGSLCDGQHRLAAVIRADMAIVFMVTYDVPRESGRSVDLHAQRQAYDALRIGGAPQWLDKTAVSIVRALMCGLGSSRGSTWSVDMLLDYALQYADQVQFAASLIANKKRNITTAGLAASYMCALCAGEDPEDLRRFSTAMVTGEISGPSENAAIRLREYLMFSSDAWSGTGRFSSTKRSQRAIQAFCRSTPLSKLYEPEKLIYPIPVAHQQCP